jgi:hypothetical protein
MVENFLELRGSFLALGSGPIRLSGHLNSMHVCLGVHAGCCLAYRVQPGRPEPRMAPMRSP